MAGGSESTDSGDQSVLVTFSNYVDKNLPTIKKVVYTAGVITVIALARHLRFHKKFNLASEIPVEFFERNVKLRGTVKERLVGTSVLLVDHSPPLPVRCVKLLNWSSRENQLLRVSMAGVKLTEGGEKWVDGNLINRSIWFKLLEAPDVENIPAIVTCRTKNSIYRRNVNSYLIKQGFGQVVDRYDEEPISLVYSSLRRQLLVDQTRAQRKGKGDWDKPSWREWLKERFKWMKKAK